MTDDPGMDQTAEGAAEAVLHNGVTVAQANSTLRMTARNAAWWLRYSAGFVPEHQRANMVEIADELDAAVNQSNDALDALAFGKGK